MAWWAFFALVKNIRVYLPFAPRTLRKRDELALDASAKILYV
jgi:hypothetical protein